MASRFVHRRAKDLRPIGSGRISEFDQFLPFDERLRRRGGLSRSVARRAFELVQELPHTFANGVPVRKGCLRQRKPRGETRRSIEEQKANLRKTSFSGER